MEPQEVTGTLAPLLDSGGTVGVAYRTDGINSADIYALWVLYVYFDRVLYEKLRVMEALSYSPQANYIRNVDYGIFAATADAELDKLNALIARIDMAHQSLACPMGRDKRRIRFIPAFVRDIYA